MSPVFIQAHFAHLSARDWLIYTFCFIAGSALSLPFSDKISLLFILCGHLYTRIYEYLSLLLCLLFSTEYIECVYNCPIFRFCPKWFHRVSAIISGLNFVQHLQCFTFHSILSNARACADSTAALLGVGMPVTRLAFDSCEPSCQDLSTESCCQRCQRMAAFYYTTNIHRQLIV